MPQPTTLAFGSGQLASKHPENVREGWAWTSERVVKHSTSKGQAQWMIALKECQVWSLCRENSAKHS
eukprot:4408044-Karenia_brevis.AAC.1